ncbi:hypothetical protein SAMN04487759_11127 [Kandleria vitulina]|jgi:predicted DNA-binding protein YlxM (UPF0122 family)|uniref:UPF0122 protein SAMN04487759_11127 n=1 Tax=Kandleria vitulina TaxID=1630 RepID=A0A1H2SXC6_9FIRM|nr:hypothetical protein SAMN05216520_11046 [Kandleria vitulina]SDW36157.1 hypothetical protein SAMN04487759_11127 [Kandleria vitulina]SEI66137.1 hypothetical protein SAMN05216514_10248 [Kandleria vitulina]
MIFVEDLLEKKEHVILLMDCYKEMLTDKQKEYLELYYEEDLSLSEIADDLGVSRNAVYDNLRRALKSMERYEEKLQLLEKHKERMALIDKIEQESTKDCDEIEEYLEMLRRI